MCATYIVRSFNAGRAEFAEFTNKAVADAYYDCMVEADGDGSVLMTESSDRANPVKCIEYTAYEVRRDDFDGNVDFESFTDYADALECAYEFVADDNTDIVTIDGHYTCNGYSDQECLWNYSNPSMCAGPAAVASPALSSRRRPPA